MTFVYLWPPVWGWGGLAAFLSHPARITLTILLFAMSAVALSEGSPDDARRLASPQFLEHQNGGVAPIHRDSCRVSRELDSPDVSNPAILFGRVRPAILEEE